MEGGNTRDTLEYWQYFEKKLTYLTFPVVKTVLSSTRSTLTTYRTDGVLVTAKSRKRKYGKPCITVGNIRDPKVAEDILARGDADFIGMGRGLIADPEWVNKVEFGNECDIRKCISCNIGCAGHRIGLKTSQSVVL